MGLMLGALQDVHNDSREDGYYLHERVDVWHVLRLAHVSSFLCKALQYPKQLHGAFFQDER